MTDAKVETIPVATGTVRRVADQHEWRSICGMRRDLVSAEEGQPTRVHYMRISDSKKHYHQRTTEYYYITEGRGEVELDDEVFEVTKGDLVVIPPYTRHTSRPADGEELHALLFVIPERGPDGEPDHSPDEHYDE